MNRDQLLRLKEKIDLLEREVAQYEGQLEQLKRNLREMGCDSIGAAKKRLEELEGEIAELEDQYRADVQAIEEAMSDWDE